MESQQAQTANAIRNASDYLSLLMGKPSVLFIRLRIGFCVCACQRNDNSSWFACDYMAMQKAIDATGQMIKAEKELHA
jgi:hypothetical protein